MKPDRAPKETRINPIIENPYDKMIESIDRRIQICDEGIKLADAFIYTSLGGLGLIAIAIVAFAVFDKF